MFSSAGEQSSTLKEIRQDGKQILLSSMHVKILVPPTHSNKSTMVIEDGCSYTLTVFVQTICCIFIPWKWTVYYYYYYVGIYQKVFWPIFMTSNSFDSHPMWIQDSLGWHECKASLWEYIERSLLSSNPKVKISNKQNVNWTLNPMQSRNLVLILVNDGNELSIHIANVNIGCCLGKLDERDSTFRQDISLWHAMAVPTE